MKRALKAAAVLLALAVVAWLGLDVWGGRQLAGQEETWRQDIAAERARVAALRMPVLRGEPIEENAVARYRPLLSRPYDAALLARAISTGVTGSASPEVQAKLDSSRSDIATLREAVRCNRADWEVQWEKGWEAEIPPIAGARMLAQLAILEGVKAARAGDLQGAAEHDLDMIRFGSDFGASGVLILDLIGVAIHRMATEALSTLVTTQKPEDLSLAQIAAELAKLEPVLPTLVDGMRGERRSWGFLTRATPSAALFEHMDGWSGWERIFFYVVPRRALAAHALSEMDPRFREVEQAIAELDPARGESLAAAVGNKVAGTWNPIVRASVPSLVRARVSADEERARFGLLVGAVRLEQARARDHEYPATLADLPIDPFAYPAPLHYEPTPERRGYRLWSIGVDRKDQGGQAAGYADIVLERKP